MVPAYNDPLLERCGAVWMFLKRMVLGVAAICCILAAIWVSHSMLSLHVSEVAAAVKHHNYHSESSRD